MKLRKTYLKISRLHPPSSCQLRQTSVPVQEQKKQIEPCTLSSLLQPVNRAFKHTKHRRSTLVVIFNFFSPENWKLNSFIPIPKKKKSSLNTSYQNLSNFLLPRIIIHKCSLPHGFIGFRRLSLQTTAAFSFSPKVLSTLFSQMSYEYQTIHSPNKSTKKIKENYMEVTRMGI